MRKFSFDISVAALDDCSYDSVALSYKLLLFFFFRLAQVRIVSAHRTPEMMFSYASSARERGIQVIIAGAGGAAHLPGQLAIIFIFHLILNI